MSAAIPLPILPFRGIAALKEFDQLILACPFLPSLPFGDGGEESAAYFPHLGMSQLYDPAMYQLNRFPGFQVMHGIVIFTGKITSRFLLRKNRALRASGALRGEHTWLLWTK